MELHRARSVLVGGALLALAGCVVEQPVVVRQPPPVPATQVEVVPAPPGPTHVWVPGHWAWRGPRRGYVWVPGRYALPAHPGYVWIPGHWAQGPAGWVWVEGHWRAR